MDTICLVSGKTEEIDVEIKLVMGCPDDVKREPGAEGMVSWLVCYETRSLLQL